jgi:energy-coupling factor transport system ATP-binding protein
MEGERSPSKLSRKNPSAFYLEKVSFSWPSGIKALDQCSLSIPSSGLWMLVGANGSGKSTLFRLISGMLQPNSGQIHCSLKPLLMFQNPDHQLLMPSCRSDLALSLPRGLTIKERLQRMREALEQVDLAGVESRPIHTLSGGQKQRLALAGALVSDATLLLLDEPTALLDLDSQQAVLKTVSKLCRRSKNPLTALWITHRLEELEYCDGAAMMDKGQIGEWFSGDLLIQRLKLLAGRRV